MGSSTALLDKPTTARPQRGFASRGDQDDRRGFGNDNESLNATGALDDPDAARFLAMAGGGDDDATTPMLDSASGDDDVDSEQEASEDEPQGSSVYPPVEDNPRDESLQMWMRKTKSTKLLSAAEEIDPPPPISRHLRKGPFR